MKRKLLGLVLCLSMVFCIFGCGKKDTDTLAGNTQTESESGEENSDAVEPDSNESDTDTTGQAEESKTTAADANRVYQKFLNNEEPVYFDCFKDDPREQCYTYVMMSSQIVPDKAYSFAEFMESYCAGMGDYFEEKGVPQSVEYSFIDCGNDGIPELAIRINDLEFSYNDICCIFVFKLIDDKLQCVFMDEFGYRTWGTLNEFGYYVNGGSSGAASYECSYQSIDGDGNVHFDYSDSTSNSMWAFFVPDNDKYEKVAEEQGISDSIQIDRYSLEEFDSTMDTTDYYSRCMYAFTPMDEMYNPLEGDELAAAYKEGSPYMIFWESTGLPLSTDEEVQDRIKEHEAQIGITEEIKSGDEASWMPVSGTQLNNVMSWNETSASSVYVLENPSYEYYFGGSGSDVSGTSSDALDSTAFTKIDISQLSATPNEIIDEDNWFEELGISQPDRLTFEDRLFIYNLYGTDSDGLQWYPYMMDICDLSAGEPMYTLDFGNYYYPDEYAPADAGFVEESIHWAESKDGILYVSTYHMTYASSGPHNGYITAFDMNDDFRVLWKTEPLTCNSDNFVIVDDAIICGYGFTNEDDFIYVLDRATGKRVQTHKVKTGPDWFVMKDGALNVRCYDTNYVFELTGK